MSSSPFHECPECEAEGDWCEDGVCTSCGYDVFEDSELVREGYEHEDECSGDHWFELGECIFCGTQFGEDTF